MIKKHNNPLKEMQQDELSWHVFISEKNINEGLKPINDIAGTKIALGCFEEENILTMTITASKSTEPAPTNIAVAISRAMAEAGIEHKRMAGVPWIITVEGKPLIKTLENIKGTNVSLLKEKAAQQAKTLSHIADITRAGVEDYKQI